VPTPLNTLEPIEKILCDSKVDKANEVIPCSAAIQVAIRSGDTPEKTQDLLFLALLVL